MKFTQRFRYDFTENLRQGLSFADSCTLTGVVPSTVYAWCKKYSWFQLAVDKARVRAKVDCIKTVRNAAKRKNVAAAEWWLERRHPEEFGARNKIEITDPLKETAEEEVARKARMKVMLDEIESGVKK